MKTISLRTFRVAVDRLTESVQVAKREDGQLRILGTWTPISAALTPDNLIERIMAQAEPRTFRPVPKPSKRSRQTT